MDAERFDRLSRVLGKAVTRRGMLGVLAGLAGLGLTEATATRRRQRRHRPGRARARHVHADDKVTLCHRTGSPHHPFQVITVAPSAVPAHQAHGDLVHCPNLQVIDFTRCTCVCPVADIVCPNGHLDPATCECVADFPMCDATECERGNDACRQCRCAGPFCNCLFRGCPCDPESGCPPCDPVTGCP